MEFEYLVEGRSRTLTLEKKGGAFVVREGAEAFECEIRPVSENELVVIAGGRSVLVAIARDEDRTFVAFGGREYVLKHPVEDAGGFHRADEKSADEGLTIKAPMPGKVIKIQVAEGDEVRKNQTLAIVEAMKMENEIKSGIEGLVKKVFVAAGDLVDSEKILLELEPKTA